MNQSLIDDFLQTLSSFYVEYGRHDMRWRQPETDGSFDPYKILVSEMMLQQTQVARVIPKFTEFMAKFPTIKLLAQSTIGEVLQSWSGLGYNRRAKFLRQAAETVAEEYDGIFPATIIELQRLPGVGPNTAGAIAAYAFNQPVVYIETNIRTVMIHHFFRDETEISDNSIRDVMTEIVQNMAHANSLSPREFYWAMMDYGAYLKKSIGNLNRVSTSYSKQSTFSGSRRQLRGIVIRVLTERPYQYSELTAVLGDTRAESVITELIREGLVTQADQLVCLL